MQLILAVFGMLLGLALAVVVGTALLPVLLPVGAVALMGWLAWATARGSVGLIADTVDDASLHVVTRAAIVLFVVLLVGGPVLIFTIEGLS